MLKILTGILLPTQCNVSRSPFHSFVVFGLNLLYTALKRSRFDFQDPDVLAKLEAIVVVVGNALYSIFRSTSRPTLLSKSERRAVQDGSTPLDVKPDSAS